MIKLEDNASLSGIPMGPALREFLGIDAYKGGDRVDDSSSDELALLVRTVLEKAREGLPNETTLVDLMDELVAMDLPDAVLALQKIGTPVWSGRDFRGLLAHGVSAMLTGDLVAAEKTLRQAQMELPKEPAPYVNLAQIKIHLGDEEGARTWLATGLEVDPNHLRLWDLFASLEHERSPGDAASKVHKEAEQRDSWAGLALAAELAADGDNLRKLRYLEPLYGAGERDPNFLVEFTAALGVAGEYARIPEVVWDARRRFPMGLPWQLYAHGAQAQMALGKAEEARLWVEAAWRDPALPDEARNVLGEMLTAES